MFAYDIIRDLIIHPFLIKINKDYIFKDTEDPSIVLFKTRFGDHYVLRVDISNIILIISEQMKGHEHAYERYNTMLRKDDVVVDLGAGDGFFTLKAASLCKKVYAFEPHPIYAKLLRKTFKGNEKVEIVEIGISDKKGSFYMADVSFGSRICVDKPMIGFEIRTDTLDNILYDKTRIDYIKCDIEGTEIDMLKGAEKIIRRDKPRIAICIYHKPGDPERIEAILREYVPEYEFKNVKNCVLHAAVP